MSTFLDPRAQITRRGLFAGSAVGLAAAATLALEEKVNAATVQGSLPSHVDVVIIGGGISGLLAARNVLRSGRTALVVEARNRVGGRVLNHQLGTGGTIESGGAFVGPTQGHLRHLAREYGIDTFTEYTAGNSVYISSATGRQTYSGTVPPDPAILLDAALLQQNLDSMAAEIPVDAPWSHPKAAEWDAMTLGDYIRANALNKDAIVRLIECWTEPGFGAVPDQLSLLYVLHYIACSGDETHVGTFERNSNTTDGAQESRFVGGSQRVPLAIARELGSHVALNAPVTRVDQGNGGAVVHTARGNVSCKLIITATTPEHALGIDWRPGMAAGRKTLLTRMHMGALMKCDAVYDKPFWRAKGLNGFGISDTGPVRAAFDNGVKNTNHGVLLCFMGGHTLAKYGAMTAAARRTAVLQGFATMFGNEALKPIEYVEHDWRHERWTGGGPVAIYGPGTMSTFGRYIRQPWGHVHWAGTETSTYWTGYMDGAVRAGQRAALEVTDRLR